MRREELNRIFTEKVAQYLAEGYMIDPMLMNGMQGEIAKVIMRKDDKILGIVMQSYYSWSAGVTDGISISTGFYKKPFKSSHCHDTVWLNEFDYFEVLKFVSLNHMIVRDDINRNEWLVTEAEYAALKSKIFARRDARCYKESVKLSTVPVAIYNRVKNTRGHKRAKLSDIRIERVTDFHTNVLMYRIFDGSRLVFTKYLRIV